MILISVQFALYIKGIINLQELTILIFQVGAASPHVVEMSMGLNDAAAQQ